MKLQNYYRGMQARRLAEFVARKEAFYKAQTMALDEAKKKIEAEFEAKEAETGTVTRMKWDAKVRMRQSKMNAKGAHVDREGTVAMLMDEAIQIKEKEVKARWIF